MSFEIRVNGQPFGLWESASVNRSIDRNSGVFRFSNSAAVPLSEYPVKGGDFVEVLILGVRKVAGFVDQVTDGMDDNSHTIEVSGRDNVADLIDSSVPDNAKVSEGPISLKKLCETVVSAIGAKIKIIQEVPDISDFTSEDLQAAGSGETCMSYLVSFARKRQVYLVPDGSGNLVIFRPVQGDKIPAPLVHRRNGTRNNVLTYSAIRSQQNRFNKYLCRSQDNFGFDGFAEYFGDGTDRNDEVTDSQIRTSRYLEIQSEESMTDSECKKRAAEEANIRRALGTEYTPTVADIKQTDGTIWDFGQFANVVDEYADISGLFLIKSVEYAIDITKGSRTRLTCVPPDAYQVEAEPTKESKRSASTGTTFENKVPKTQDMTLR